MHSLLVNQSAATSACQNHKNMPLPEQWNLAMHEAFNCCLCTNWDCARPCISAQIPIKACTLQWKTILTTHCGKMESDNVLNLFLFWVFLQLNLFYATAHSLAQVVLESQCTRYQQTHAINNCFISWAFLSFLETTTQRTPTHLFPGLSSSRKYNLIWNEDHIYLPQRSSLHTWTQAQQLQNYMTVCSLMELKFNFSAALATYNNTILSWTSFTQPISQDVSWT